MFSLGPAEAQNVVQINKDSRNVLEDILKEALKALGGVLHPHTESPEIKHTPGGGDASFMPISLVNEDLMKGFPEINLAEDGRALDLLGIASEVRKRKLVQLSLEVQISIVPDRAEAAPGLRGEM